jgi:histidinol-phosphate aminotransferase
MDDFIDRQARPQIFNLKPYVPGKPIEEVKRELGLTDVIKMASNENPLGPAPLAKQAIIEHLGDMHIYPDSSYRDLKAKLALRLQVDTDCVAVGNGSDEILKMLAEAFLNPGDEVILPHPTFSEYEFVSTVMGAKCIQVPLLNNTHDLKAMLECVSPRTKIIFICNPNNPTGTMVTGEALSGFINRLSRDVLLVIDEAYSEYVESPEYRSAQALLEKRPQTIVLRTFSKLYGLAALRLGYGISSPAIISTLERVREPFNVNSLAQYAGMAALDDAEHIAESLRLNRCGKAYLYQVLAGLGLEYTPTEANFIFIDTGRDAGMVFRGMLKKGVIIRSCESFGCPTSIRVTVGTPEQNQRFIKALQSVLQEIEG